MTALPSRVLVLHESLGQQSRPDELDALVQLDEVSAALRRLRCTVTAQPVSLDLQTGLEALSRAAPDCVFNLVEGLGGHGALIGLVPALLESASMAFTGSGSAAINLSSNKLLAKQWMRLHDIATPHWNDCQQHERNLPSLNRDPWIVKSLWEHASLGLDDGSVVSGQKAAEDRIALCARTYGGGWFAERYIEGREFNVSLLEQDGQPQVLPIAEMTFVDYPPGKPRIVGYAAKWDPEAPEFAATERCFHTLPVDEQKALEVIAKRCWEIFDLRGYARVDLRVDSAGVAWVLEINANPCLARDAGFVAAVEEQGIPFEQLIHRVLQAALRPGLPLLRSAG